MTDPREHMRHRLTGLLLAREDMEQAAAAARAVIAWMPPDVALMRALETGMAVSYARPFVDATLPGARLSKADRPTSEGERELHDLLLWFRRKVYAHTDAESGRNASPIMPPEAGWPDGIPGVGYGSTWQPFPRERLTEVVEVCDRQAQRFLDEAMSIRTKLGLGL